MSVIGKPLLIAGAIGKVSGAIASFPDGNGDPLRSLLVNIDPVQEGTGDPSPDNVRPISGWSAVNVWRMGKNVWDEEWRKGNYSDLDGTFYVPSTAYLCSKNLIPVKPNTTYFSIITTRKFYYDASGNYLGNTSNTSGEFTTPDNCYFMNFRAVDYTADYGNDISINYPSTDHDYHPYSGNQYTIQLGDTYYGGTLDVTNGALVVDRANIFASPTWTPKNISTLSGYTRWQFYSTDTGITLPADGTNKGRFSHGTYKANYSEQSNHAYINNTSTPATIFVISGVEATEAGIQTYIAQQNANGTPLQVVYPLATPITIPLTPQEISTLQGQNNVWADTGPVDVEYIKRSLMYMS